MRRAVFVLAALAASAIPAGPACAQAFIGFATGQPVQLERAVTARVTVKGQLAVRFQGDRSGTVTWTPSSPADLVALVYKSGARTEVVGYLAFEDYESGASSRTSATVRRMRPDGSQAACADASTNGSSLELSGTGNTLGVGFDPSVPSVEDLLASRCGGPLATDLAGALPLKPVSLDSLVRGRKIDLSSHGTFASHGFNGTVDSTLELDVGHGSSRSAKSLQEHERYRKVRHREVDVSYAVEAVSGGVSVDLTGDSASPLCRALDACDLSGTVRMSPALTTGRLTLSATAPVRVSDLSLLERVGLANGRGRHPIALRGFGDWEGSGVVSAELRRSGSPACSDSVPLDGGDLRLETHGGSLLAGYFPATEADFLRTRCPGPGLADVFSGDAYAIATGSLPIEALRQPVLSLHLGTGSSFAGSGYTGTVRPDLTVTLRRTRIRERVVTDRLALDEFKFARAAGRG